MYWLDKDQVNKIIHDVAQAKITLSHLEDDLIDHICCEVEQLMEEGKGFDEAYDIVKTETGISVLVKIQEDTKYMIDKNYRLMKTTMKITGNISLALIMFGTVFKIMHWPYSGITLALGFLIVCTVFFPLAVYINYKDNKEKKEKKNIILHISLLISGVAYMLGVVSKILHIPGAGPLLLIGYLSLIFVVLPILLYSKIKSSKDKKDKNIFTFGFIGLTIYGLSSLFKIMHWPGAWVLMVLGGILLISVFLPMYTKRRIQLEGKITGQFIYTVVITMFFVLFTSLLALNVSEDYLNVFTDNTSNEISIDHYLKDNNSKKLAEIETKAEMEYDISDALNISQQAEIVCSYILELQTHMITQIEPDNPNSIEDILEDPILIKNKANIAIVSIHLLGINEDGEARILKKKLKHFQDEIRYGFEEINLSKLSNELLNLDNQNKWGTPISWEKYHFENSQLAGAISTLQEFKTNVRILESKALDHIKSRAKL